MQQNTQAGRIVVGVDGSSRSEGALRWAIEQAQLSGAVVEAVSSWQDPATSGYGLGFLPVPSGEDSWAALTEKYLQESVAEVVGRTAGTVKIVTRVEQGHPAQVLLDAARGARLLVVGTRGHGTLAGVLLGSVSQHVVQHASCPVVVVPEDGPADPPEADQP
jgi:nucleotide-binding universal stress UspA family protein